MIAAADDRFEILRVQLAVGISMCSARKRRLRLTGRGMTSWGFVARHRAARATREMKSRCVSVSIRPNYRDGSVARRRGRSMAVAGQRPSNTELRLPTPFLTSTPLLTLPAAPWSPALPLLAPTATTFSSAEGTRWLMKKACVTSSAGTAARTTACPAIVARPSSVTGIGPPAGSGGANSVTRTRSWPAGTRPPSGENPFGVSTHFMCISPLFQASWYNPRFNPLRQVPVVAIEAGFRPARVDRAVPRPGLFRLDNRRAYHPSMMNAT